MTDDRCICGVCPIKDKCPKMEEIKQHFDKTKNKDGCRWLAINEDIFKNEEVDAIHIEMRGFAIFLHKK